MTKEMKNKKEKDISKLQLTGKIGVSTTNVALINLTSSTTVWRGGWVTDNFSTYYLDGDMVKHQKQPKK